MLRNRFFCCALTVAAFCASSLQAGNDGNVNLSEATPAIRSAIDAEYSSLEAFYKELHIKPELSKQEVVTSGKLAEQMEKIGFKVTRNIGGHGIVCLFKNGDGPTIMVRTDMDALPVVEKTGLPYASKVATRLADGTAVGVMHACGHDMHMTCWIGTARTLVAMKDKWRGTLMFLGQPAEETGSGAMSMISDNLFKKFKKPDFALALHVDSYIPFGTIGFTEGNAMANVDSVDITFIGRGGHGSTPQQTIDPIMIAARFIVDVQAIVSREIDPQDAAVITVGSIHAGSKHNIIPSDAKLQLTVRSFNAETRKHLLSGIERFANASAEAAKAPKPTVAVREFEHTPFLHNDPALTKKTVAALRSVFKPEAIVPKAPLMGGEDFSRYGREGIPIFLFRLGTIPQELIDNMAKTGVKPPSIHSDKYYPIPEPSIRMGVQAMSTAVLNLLPAK